MKDALGDRIKSQYEDRTRHFLPRRTYTIIRVDGKAFHTLTKSCAKPFDKELMRRMDQTAIALCSEIQGAKFAYTQSDEISILLTDFDKITTDAWFDGNIQKMASVAAACATAHFNANTIVPVGVRTLAMFDARVFTIPDAVEVENYFIWRQNDASRNSVQMAARAVYSHKELEGKGVPQLHDLLMAKNINWNNYSSGEKRGRCIVKQEVNFASEYVVHQHGQAKAPDNITRNKWVSLTGTEPIHVQSFGNLNEGGKIALNETPIFTQDRKFLRDLIPQMPQFIPAEEASNDKG